MFSTYNYLEKNTFFKRRVFIILWFFSSLLCFIDSNYLHLCCQIVRSSGADPWGVACSPSPFHDQLVVFGYRRSKTNKMKFYIIYLWSKCQKKSNQLITLLNEGECFSYVIFLENYSNGISQNKMYETTMTKIIRIFTLWCNGSI